MKNTLVNAFYYISGIFFLVLAKIKSVTLEYTPRPFSEKEIQQSVKYDMEVVDNWLNRLSQYIHEDGSDFIKNKSILELGPGSDLGIGLYLLGKGAEKYTAIDVYDIASKSSSEFYQALFRYLREKDMNISLLQEELNNTQMGHSNKLNFICSESFDIVSALKDEKIDVFFSNAAFEHFNNIEQTIKDVTEVASKNAVFAISVDLKTHSRWIRDKDPNNIYKYPNWLYKLLTHLSSPNRKRPVEYRKLLEKYGWSNIVIQPGKQLQDDKYDTLGHLNKRFRDPENQMDYLSVHIYATKR